MRYVLLIYGDEAELKARPEEELRHLGREAVARDDRLRRAGHLIARYSLEWTPLATSLRTKGGTIVKTDGPFAETKEQLLGFLLIEAKDREEAIAVASELPMVAGNTIEVRAVGECG